MTDPELHPQSEEYWGHVNPIGPRACYDEGKRVAETMCYAYEKQVRNWLTITVKIIYHDFITSWNTGAHKFAHLFSSNLFLPTWDVKTLSCKCIQMIKE